MIDLDWCISKEIKFGYTSYAPYECLNPLLQNKIMVHKGVVSRDNGAPHGYGVRVLHNGDIYEGFFKFGKFQGKGYYFYRDGTVYIGNFFQDQKEGKGELLFANGDSYKGEF